jgi:endogenous inhibitor of DNA gyrase (YacG/DUF329 family)
MASRCPICKKDVVPRAENPAFPFCSERCKLIDLGKWLGEGYAIPGKPEEEEDDELPDVPTHEPH